ncbi:MAG: LIC_10190 family membrane protein [Lachnospiraceae bacterium]
MLFILLNWLYIFITTFLTGFGILYLVEKQFGYRVKHIHSYLVAGLVFATTYAQWFSCFYRVNWEANGIFLLISLVIFILYRKTILERLMSAWKDTSLAKKVGIGVLILVTAYFTSRGSYLVDTNLYHAQSIRWIEEYGVVKGLANLQSRAAYNSSMFCLSALCSMKYIFGQSMHAVQGFMALILGVYCMDLGSLWKRKKVVLSDFARIGAIYYLTLLHREIMSPTSDFAVMIILFYIVISWLDLLEEKNASTVPYSLLCVAGVYTMTLKLTAGLILILLIKPVIMLCRQKKGKEIITYLGMGILVIVPYLIRNVLICGWLLYPFSALDLFDVDWKVPKVKVDADSFQIKSWGKGIHDYDLYHSTPDKWIPGWFTTVLSSTEKLLLLGDTVALMLFGIALVYKIYQQLVQKKNPNWDVVLVQGTIVASFLFWLLSAPLTRYGYTYILLLILLMFGELYIAMWGKVPWKKPVILTVMIALFFCWKGAVLTKAIWTARSTPAYIKQTDYDSNEGEERVKEHEINGITFYYRVSGYHPLPGGDIQFTMRGDSIKDGFKFAEYNELNIFGEYLD